MKLCDNEEAWGKRQEARGNPLQGFKDLLVWQKAKDLAVQIYNNSEKGGLGKDFGLRIKFENQLSVCRAILQNCELSFR